VVAAKAVFQKKRAERREENKKCHQGEGSDKLYTGKGRIKKKERRTWGEPVIVTKKDVTACEEGEESWEDQTLGRSKVKTGGRRGIGGSVLRGDAGGVCTRWTKGGQA